MSADGGRYKFQYHYVVKYGSSVIDTLTGPNAQEWPAWVKRFDTGKAFLWFGRKPFGQVFKIEDVTGKIRNWDIQGLPYYESTWRWKR